jgi:hypothetical protein
MTVSMLELNSASMRPTDIVYKKVLDEDETEELVKYQDYSVLKTDQMKQASLPEENYLHIFPGSDAVVSKATNPLEIVIIKRPDGGLALPGGYNNLGENALDGAMRKFKEKVNFDVDGEIYEAEPLPGYLGNPEMMTLNKKSLPVGPFMGIYGLPDRDPKRQCVASLYHLMIDEKYTNPVPVEGKSEDAFFCNIFEVMARNVDQITDDVESLALKAKFDEVLASDAEVMKQEENKEKEIGEVIKCAQEWDNDYINQVYRYYQFLVTRKVLNADGSNGANLESYSWMYNKTVLMTKFKNKL